MKSLAIFVVIGLVLTGSVEIGQAQTSPAKPATATLVPTSAPTFTAPLTAPAAELALTKLKLAIAKAQIAGAASQQAQQQAQQAVATAQQLIESTKKELGLPASYQWDFQTETFVPEPSQQAGPSQPAALSAPAPPPTAK